MNELIKKLLERVKALKKVGATGFADEKEASAYFQEREVVVEDIAKALSDINDAYDQELAALKSQLGDAMKAMKQEGQTPKELSKDKFLENLGRMVRAAWSQNRSVLAELGAHPNRAERSFEWDDERSFVFSKEAGLFMPQSKASIGTPNTDASAIMNPVYERELIRYATERSDLMDLVRHIPMAEREVSWPTLKRHSGALRWHTTYCEQYQQSGRPEFGERVNIKANTLAGYIPWYDEFGEDIQINIALGELFLEMFAELYAEEFDRQVMSANNDPYKGILNYTGAGECILSYISGSTPSAIQVEDLRNAPLKIPRADRKDGMWLVSEDFVSFLMSMRNSVGDFLIQPPLEATRPGRICGFPYREIREMPSMGDVKPGKPFAWFGVPNRTLWHGNLTQIEIRSFRETTESMLHGEEFVRFRKRDAFKVVQPDLSVLLCTRA